ncbi:zincin-like metallopeptidase domain-containing protein [Novosphingobium sp.]|uniref:ArdC family protein n=1 Tax=Novosphingobium sp. TaxID=1874826 RepID=UPI0028A94ABF|nr:zincin-like metallopeptidase domain-containing protein [Novosphingobium sp.]
MNSPDHNLPHNPGGKLAGHSGDIRSCPEQVGNRAHDRDKGRAGRQEGQRGNDNRGDGRSRRGKQETRLSLYDEVTARIIAELEAGRIPWVQPWSSAACGGAGGSGAIPCLPRNALTSRSYSGINILLLWASALASGWERPGWLTFRQAIAAGGNVRKGEHGTQVVYADRFTPETEKERARESGGEARSIAFLKRFTVFNVAQCEGLPDDIMPQPVALPEREILPVAEVLIAASGVDFRVGGDKAFYAPGADFVQVPPQQAFHDQVNYYRTCLHELTHATGHKSRLGRDLTNGFGSKDYAREELVAEMGSAFLCASLGIVPTVRHADYVGAWLEVLREDARAIFRAASMASKASDWLLARHAAADGEVAEDIAAGPGLGKALEAGGDPRTDTDARTEPASQTGAGRAVS